MKSVDSGLWISESNQGNDTAITTHERLPFDSVGGRILTAQTNSTETIRTGRYRR